MQKLNGRIKNQTNVTIFNLNLSLLTQNAKCKCFFNDTLIRPNDLEVHLILTPRSRWVILGSKKVKGEVSRILGGQGGRQGVPWGQRQHLIGSFDAV